DPLRPRRDRRRALPIHAGGGGPRRRGLVGCPDPAVRVPRPRERPARPAVGDAPHLRGRDGPLLHLRAGRRRAVDALREDAALRRLKKNLSILPGLALVVAIALAARWTHARVPSHIGKLVGEVIFAVGYGLVVGNVFRIPDAAKPGIKFAYQTLLRTAIVILGATFSFGAALSIGGRAILMVVGLMTLTLATATLLGRSLGVPSKLAALIGVGTAVCGNTAISATAPV